MEPVGLQENKVISFALRKMTVVAFVLGMEDKGERRQGKRSNELGVT